MSLLFVDGVDYYGGALGSGSSGAGNDVELEDVERKWTEATTGIGTGFLEIRRGEGRFGGDVFRFGAGSGKAALRKVFVPNPTIVLGFSFKHLGGDGGFVQFEWLGNTPHCEIVMEADNTISIHDAGGNRVGGTAENGFAVNDDQWYMLEVKVTAGSAGSCVIHVNEEEWANVSGEDFLNGSTAQINSVQILEGGTSLSGVSHFADDFYILDDQGTVNNDFLGDVRIDPLLATADTVQADFTPIVAGDNYLMVDDPEFDEDDTYNFSDVVGARDMFQFEDMGETPKDIYAVAASIAARKSAAGTRGLQSIMTEGGNTLLGGDQRLITDYLYKQYIEEAAPGGGSWTRAIIDAMEAGYEVTV